MSMIPLRIKIGYADFPVRVVEKVDAEDSDGESNWGEQWIRVNSLLSRQHQALTLCHEIDHLIYIYADLEQGACEEKIVTMMSNIRVQVYRDNPQLLTFLRDVFHSNP